MNNLGISKENVENVPYKQYMLYHLLTYLNYTLSTICSLIHDCCFCHFPLHSLYLPNLNKVPGTGKVNFILFQGSGFFLDNSLYSTRQT